MKIKIEFTKDSWILCSSQKIDFSGGRVTVEALKLRKDITFEVELIEQFSKGVSNITVFTPKGILDGGEILSLIQVPNSLYRVVE